MSFSARYIYNGTGKMRSGAMNAAPSTTYRYDCHSCVNQSNLPGNTSQKYYYDGLGRRVKIEYYTGTTLTDTRKFVYLGGSVVRELNGSGQTVRDYIRDSGLGGGIGSIIYCKEGSDYYYFHYNHKGDVVSVTDADKEEVAYYEYDAWGNTMTEAGTWSSPYRFSTKEWDDDSGLYHFGARYYSPEIGRWTQRDPAGTTDGLNLYLYVNNRPVSRIDHWGKQCDPWHPPNPFRTIETLLEAAGFKKPKPPKPGPSYEWGAIVDGGTVYMRASFNWQLIPSQSGMSIGCAQCVCEWNVLVRQQQRNCETGRVKVVERRPHGDNRPVKPPYIWAVSGSMGPSNSDYDQCMTLCRGLGQKKAMKYNSYGLVVIADESMGQLKNTKESWGIGPAGNLYEVPAPPPNLESQTPQY